MTAENRFERYRFGYCTANTFLGAEICGIDLSQPISSELAQALHDTFHQSSALVFRG